MKKIVSFIVAMISFIVLNATPNKKILNNFEELYPGATGVVWSDHNNTYEVFFEKGAVKLRLFYDEEGNIIKSIRYYSGAELPPIVLSKIQKRYHGMAVGGVTEMTDVNSGKQYFINLKDDKYLIKVTADDMGGLEQTDRLFNKG